MSSPRVIQAPDEGDPFMLPSDYVDRRTEEIARDFGRAFSEEIAGLEPKQWQGPVTSAYGLHLVYIASREESRQPSLEQVRSQVANDWLVEQRRMADQRIFERLRSRYNISVVGEQAGSR